jgi:hypothetical protein
MDKTIEDVKGAIKSRNSKDKTIQWTKEKGKSPKMAEQLLQRKSKIEQHEAD